MKNFLLLIFLVTSGFVLKSNAQFTRYVIRLKDKGTSPFTLNNPSQYLSARAIARRTRYGIAVDSADLPITPRYIDSIRMAGAVTILNTSKWLNQVAIQTSDAAALAKINSFPFVQGSNPVAARPTQKHNEKLENVSQSNISNLSPLNIAADHYNYGQSYAQVHLHNGEFLHNRGFRGQGMHMAVIDAGFQNYLTMPTFDSVRNSGQILGTWDFVTGNASVNEDHPHGTNCFSTIAANMPGVFVGTAPKTSFYLYRTEEAATEYPIEEQHWAAAAERADSLGVDVCSVSLGYNTFDNPVFDYIYANMDGNTTMIAKAADVAAKKGMLIVVAAGNSGSSSWRYIISPADADSVLAVGAVNTSGAVAGFSSYGPSSDGQIKPSVAAVGWNAVVANTSNGMPTFSNGTSFACPNMAGLATCLWQAFPEVNNMTIINTLQQVSNRFANPDDRSGYGIPDVKKAFAVLLKQGFTKQFTQNNCRSNLQWTVKTDSVISIAIERKLAGEANYTVINTQTSTGAFAARNFAYTDDLINVTANSISYRLRINIAADTSFYLDSAAFAFTPKPILGTDKAISSCPGSIFNLSTQYVTSGLNSNWTISGNTVSNPASVTTPGIYQLIATNVSGCADTALVTASNLVKPNFGVDKFAAKCTDSSYNLLPLFATTGLTIQWTLNGNTVATPAAVVTPGVYQLTGTNASGCSDTVLVTVNNDASLCPVIIETIRISPNPLIDQLTVAIIKIAPVKINISITNALGQLVHTIGNAQAAGGQNYNIPVKHLAAGLYYVTVKINDKTEVVKAIVKR